MLRSDYSLPDFVRVGWTSDAAREVWSHVFTQVRQMWARVELESVRRGQRALAIVSVPAEKFECYMTERQTDGLLALPLYRHANAAYLSDLNASTHGPQMLACVVGKPDDAYAGRDAFKSNDTTRLGELLGYPECCRKFFDEVWNNGRYIDTTWPMAERSTHVSKPTPSTCIADANPPTNVLLRWLGLRSVFHLPCSLDCRNTATVATELREVAAACGDLDTWNRLEEILAWPVQWSALHGIAEIETPVVRVATKTDATPSKYVVRLNGSSLSIEAAPHGTRFPFTKKQTKNTIRISPMPTIGRPAEVRPAHSSAEFYLGFGFNSHQTLRKACAPIVNTIKQTGATSAFHIMCKNGALMFETHHHIPSLRVGGLDVSVERIDAARSYMPDNAERFTYGSCNDVAAAEGSNADCWVIMVGRLLELPKEQAGELFNLARTQTRSLVLYAFSDWLHETRLETLANTTGIDVVSLRVSAPGVGVIHFS